MGGSGPGDERSAADDIEPPLRVELRPQPQTAIEQVLEPVVYGPRVTFAAETGLRTSEWLAFERRDVDRPGCAVTVQRRYAGRQLTQYPKPSAAAAACRRLKRRALLAGAPGVEADVATPVSREQQRREASIRARLDARARASWC